MLIQTKGFYIGINSQWLSGKSDLLWILGSYPKSPVWVYPHAGGHLPYSNIRIRKSNTPTNTNNTVPLIKGLTSRLRTLFFLAACGWWGGAVVGGGGGIGRDGGGWCIMCGGAANIAGSECGCMLTCSKIRERRISLRFCGLSDLPIVSLPDFCRMSTTSVNLLSRSELSLLKIQFFFTICLFCT